MLQIPWCSQEQEQQTKILCFSLITYLFHKEFTYCPVVLLPPKHPVYFDDTTHDISADQFFTVSGKFMVIYGHYVDRLRNEIRRVNRWKYRWFNVSN